MGPRTGADLVAKRKLPTSTGNQSPTIQTIARYLLTQITFFSSLQEVKCQLQCEILCRSSGKEIVRKKNKNK
jgi:hypothetical protein